MISVIISSASSQLLQDVKNNIDQTIGVQYEIVAFDNSNGQRSICSIYNEGIKKAKFDLLCFMHEDVAFITSDWGKIVANLFALNNHLGVLGIAGSIYKSLAPSGWPNHTSVVETEYSHLLQSYKYAEDQTVIHRCNPDEQNPVAVATVDGVWMCVKKNVAEQFMFDEARFDKFHCYDIDFCIAAGRHYTIQVTFDILLHHFSEGNFDEVWMKETIKLHKKWSYLLPVYSRPFSKEQIQTIEDSNFFYFLSRLAHFSFPSSTAYKLLWRGRYLQRLGLRLFVRFFKYIRKVYKQTQNPTE